MGQKADFYIQCKGDHAGRPLRKPIPNCFAFNHDSPLAFEAVYALYIAGVFSPYINGSVIPFITIHNTKKILRDYLDRGIELKSLDLAKIKQADIAIANLEENLQLLKELKISYARKMFK